MEVRDLHWPIFLEVRLRFWIGTDSLMIDGEKVIGLFDGGLVNDAVRLFERRVSMLV